MLTSKRPCTKTLCGRHVFKAIGEHAAMDCTCGERPNADEQAALTEAWRMKYREDLQVSAARIRRLA